MPKISYLNHSAPFDQLSWLMLRKQSEQKLQTNEICRRVVQSYPTVHRKMEHPETKETWVVLTEDGALPF